MAKVASAPCTKVASLCVLFDNRLQSQCVLERGAAYDFVPLCSHWHGERVVVGRSSLEAGSQPKMAIRGQAETGPWQGSRPDLPFWQATPRTHVLGFG